MTVQICTCAADPLGCSIHGGPMQDETTSLDELREHGADDEPEQEETDPRAEVVCDYCETDGTKIRIETLTRTFYRLRPGWHKLPNGLIRCPGCDPDNDEDDE